MRIAFIRWLAFVQGFFCAAGAAGVDYFVSPFGSDSNSGLSSAAPWQTIARVNAASVSFAPGTRVFFLRGGEWREQLAPSSAGSAPAPIIYDAYGSGPKPKLWGSNIVPGTSFSKVSGTTSTYQISLSTPVNSVFVDHTFLHSAYITTGRTGNAAAMRAEVDNKSWFWAYISGILYVNTGGIDPRTGTHQWTVSVRDDVVASNHRDHLIFRNLVVDESAKDDAGYAFRVEGSRDVRLEDCEAYRAGKHHFGVINSTEFVGLRLRAGGDALPDLGYGGTSYLVSYSDASRSGDTSTWTDCVVENTVWGYLAFYSHGVGMGEVFVRNLTSLNAEVQTGYHETNPVHFVGGLMEGHELQAYITLNGRYTTVEGVTFKGWAGLQMGGDGDHLVQNALFAGITQSFAYGAISLNAPRCVARFNTVISAPGSNVPAYGILDAAVNSEVYGNLFWPSALGATFWVFGSSPPVSIHHNFYHLATGTFFFISDYSFRSFGQWQALGYDASSIVGDARFFNAAANDFSLRLGSGAVDQLSPQLVPSPPPLDYLGAKRLQGSAYDAGALEGAIVRSVPVDSIVMDSSHHPVLAWRTNAGRSYQVKYSSDFAAWANLGTSVAGSGGKVSLTDPLVTPVPSRRFYRIVETLP